MSASAWGALIWASCFTLIAICLTVAYIVKVKTTGKGWLC